MTLPISKFEKTQNTYKKILGHGIYECLNYHCVPTPNLVLGEKYYTYYDGKLIQVIPEMVILNCGYSKTEKCYFKQDGKLVIKSKMPNGKKLISYANHDYYKSVEDYYAKRPIEKIKVSPLEAMYKSYGSRFGVIYYADEVNFYRYTFSHGRAVMKFCYCLTEMWKGNKATCIDVNGNVFGFDECINLYDEMDAFNDEIDSFCDSTYRDENTCVNENRLEVVEFGEEKNELNFENETTITLTIKGDFNKEQIKNFLKPYNLSIVKTEIVIDK